MELGVEGGAVEVVELGEVGGVEEGVHMGEVGGMVELAGVRGDGAGRGGVNSCISGGTTVQDDHERGCERLAISDTGGAGGAQCRHGSSKTPTTQRNVMS